MPVMTYNEYPPAKSSDDTCVLTDGGHPDEPCDEVSVYPHGNGECWLGPRAPSSCRGPRRYEAIEGSAVIAKDYGICRRFMSDTLSLFT